MQASDPLYTRAELRRIHGVTSATLSRWMRERRLPKPDVAPTRKGQQWRESTLRTAGLL